MRERMRSSIKKLLAGICLLAAAAMIYPMTARAESSSAFPDIPSKIGVFIKKSSGEYREWDPSYVGNWQFQGGKISKLKVSNSSVLDVKTWHTSGKNSTIKGDHMYVEVLKPGRAQISFKVTAGKKVKRYSVKYYIREYKNPLKSITLRGVELVSKYRQDFGYDIIPRLEKGKLSQPSGRFRVTPKKGWAVEKIRYYDEDYNGVGLEKYVKNGAKLKFEPWDDVILTVYLRHKATGFVFCGIYLRIFDSDGADDLLVYSR